ncbi:zinc transport system permease protein [Loktanella fryxellensis]|uniref:High-affinity zinc uptake system membrane protein ZnuB n=1 Tax=Loktanella fryxellensis TaxID=245187 RepID=A0A1H8AKV6_9RHOB|nr:metal ABC transporter permease [Loktanella fryxellensis]SEM70409.1 zinc transport system permease protein [Loktanella fryxellensis]
MLDDFLIRAALAAVGTALAASVLGCFVVWRRMAYFGDATAHAAILGVAVALALNISVFAGVALVALVVALLIHRLSDRAQGTDTILGVLAHGSLALGLVAVTLIPAARIDLEAYLFGDVLTVSRLDLAIIWGGAGVVLAVLWVHWSALLTATLSPDLATASGIDPRRENLILILLLAGVVAVAIKVVGALLITALLVIPAAGARRIVASPEGMALLAGTLGVTAALGGVALSLQLDTPTGPSIVVAALVLFALSAVGGKLWAIGGSAP